MRFREFVDWLIETGIVPPERVQTAWDTLDEWGMADEEVEGIGMFLYDVGLAVVVSGDDVDDLEDAYRRILTKAAALSGGSVVVTDVALGDGPVEDRLTFRRNGEPTLWDEDHNDPDYIDQLSVMEQIGTLAPGGDDPRRFYGLLTGESNTTHYYFLLTAAQADAMRADLGLDLTAVKSTIV